MLGALSLIVLMVSWGRKATEGGEKKEEEAATAGDEEVKFTVMIMDTVDTVSPINIFHCHDHGHRRHTQFHHCHYHGHCRHSFTH